MDKWEYKFVFGRCDPANWLLADPGLVNDYGREGWAVVVSASLYLEGWTQTVLLVLKRLAPPT